MYGIKRRNEQLLKRRELIRNIQRFIISKRLTLCVNGCYRLDFNDALCVVRDNLSPVILIGSM